MYRDLDKKRTADRERQNRRRGKVVTPVTPLVDVTPQVTHLVTPSVTPKFVQGMGAWVKKRGKVTIPGAMKTVADVPKLTPRSIGIGGDSKSEMMKRFIQGK
jgi:hypothetical protein